jgi:hypothetical protein
MKLFGKKEKRLNLGQGIRGQTTSKEKRLKNK